MLTTEHCCAERGECTANAHYMVGGADGLGHCEVSCGTCTVCAEGDHECLGSNRARHGYLGDLQPELQRIFADKEEKEEEDTGEEEEEERD